MVSASVFFASYAAVLAVAALTASDTVEIVYYDFVERVNNVISHHIPRGSRPSVSQ
jgi:hypothetical protein